jgi:hypothetical protein
MIPTLDSSKNHSSAERIPLSTLQPRTFRTPARGSSLSFQRVTFPLLTLFLNGYAKKVGAMSIAGPTVRWKAGCALPYSAILLIHHENYTFR